MNEPNSVIRPMIQATPCGRNGLVTLTARHGEEVIAYEKVDLSKPRAREQFIQSLAEKLPNIDTEAIDSELVAIGARLAAQPTDVAEKTAQQSSQKRLAKMPQ